MDIEHFNRTRQQPTRALGQSERHVPPVPIRMAERSSRLGGQKVNCTHTATRIAIKTHQIFTTRNVTKIHTIDSTRIETRKSPNLISFNRYIDSNFHSKAV